MNLHDELEFRPINQDYRFIELDPKTYGKNNFRIELILEKPRRPFTKDQRNRMHRKLGIPTNWTRSFTWDKEVDRQMINGLAIFGNKSNFLQSINNVVLEIIHCIAVGRVTYDNGFNRIDNYVQKLLLSKIDEAISRQQTTLQVTTFFIATSTLSNFVWLKDVPIFPEEIKKLEEFMEQCRGNQKEILLQKLRLFSHVPNFLNEIEAEIKIQKNSSITTDEQDKSNDSEIN